MQYIEKIFRSLGTMICIQIGIQDEKISIEHGKEILVQAKAIVETMDDLFSIYKSDSDISRMNHFAGEKEVLIHPFTMQLLQMSLQYQKDLHGDFDISLEKITTLWGIGKKRAYIPDEEKIWQIQKEKQIDFLTYDTKKQAAYLKNKNQTIDLGSVAKGYAANQIILLLKKKEIKEAMLNFGGTIYTIGKRKTIGIQNPFQKVGSYLGTVSLENEAAVTSGYYEQFFEKNEKKYHHIMNPKTGSPVDNSLASITLIGKDAAYLDALSTAVYVRGIEQGYKLLEEKKVEGIFVLKTGEVFYTKGLTNRFLLNQQEVNDKNGGLK